MKRVLIGVLFLPVLPLYAQMIDLTTADSQGFIGTVLFAQGDDSGATGTGRFDSFLRIQGKDVEQGFNVASGEPTSWDTKDSTVLTEASVPVVVVNGTAYGEFLLDINQSKSKSLLSLDNVKIALSDSSTLSSYSDIFASPVFSFAPDDWIKLDAALSSGSGKSDMRMLVPDSLLADKGAYIYLYSQFGANPPDVPDNQKYAANGGFEEWGISTQTSVPEPTMIALFTVGLGLWTNRRK
jgi:hypothetical protein